MSTPLVAVLSPTELSAHERSRLADLEAVVERGMQAFVEVGLALKEIHKARLYRQTHPSFASYCEERWGFSRQRAHQLIEAAALSTVVDVSNERQARELIPLRDEPEQLREAWAEASSDGAPTALKVREAVASRMDVHYSSSTPEWDTPRWLFDALDAEFGFTLDVCATPANAKCERYFTPELNGLDQKWSGACWMNPPYGRGIVQWVEKAYVSARRDPETIVVCLVPARVDTGWWWDYCRQAEVRFLRGRIAFGGGENAAPFPSSVVVMGRPPSTRYWELNS